MTESYEIRGRHGVMAYSRYEGSFKSWGNEYIVFHVAGVVVQMNRHLTMPGWSAYAAYRGMPRSDEMTTRGPAYNLPLPAALAKAREMAIKCRKHKVAAIRASADKIAGWNPAKAVRVRAKADRIERTIGWFYKTRKEN